MFKWIKRLFGWEEKIKTINYTLVEQEYYNVTRRLHDLKVEQKELLRKKELLSKRIDWNRNLSIAA